MPEKLTLMLYVEDEPDIQAAARLALESLGGFTVEICCPDEEAMARAPGFQPQLILPDAMMPGMDGPATLKKLRGLSQFADTPAVFMTAKVQPGEAAGCKEPGAPDVIAKPFDPMMLAGQAEAIWERSHG